MGTEFQFRKMKKSWRWCQIWLPFWKKAGSQQLRYITEGWGTRTLLGRGRGEGGEPGLRSLTEWTRGGEKRRIFKNQDWGQCPSQFTGKGKQNLVIKPIPVSHQGTRATVIEMDKLETTFVLI